MAGKAKIQRLEFIGDHHDDSIVIGSHGNTRLKVEGTFDLSGIIYAPKYSVTITANGRGKLTFRGICQSITISKLKSAVTLDLSQLVCREIRILSASGTSVIIAGRVRAITPAFLYDYATLQLSEKPLIFNPVLSSNARVSLPTSDEIAGLV